MSNAFTISTRLVRLAGEHSQELSSAYQRLSSGLRINSAKDDAAGLALATHLNSQARIFGQAVNNVNDGASLLNIAESALREMANITERQMELAQQASNSAYSTSQRTALQKEASALGDEYDRILHSATFNGINIGTLLGNQQTVSIQSGSGQANAIDLTFSLQFQTSETVGDGTFSSSTSFTLAGGHTTLASADVNGDGHLDLINAGSNGVGVALGNGDGTFKAAVTYTAGTTPMSVKTGDFNGDGKLDLAVSNFNTDNISIMLGNGDGTFAAQFSTAASADGPADLVVADFNNDGKLDVAAVSNNSGNSVWLYLGNGNGTLAAGKSFAIGNGPRGMGFADFDNDGNLDIVAANTTTNTVTVLLGNGDGTFKAKVSYAVGTSDAHMVLTQDVNGDSIEDLVVTDGNTDTVNVLLGNANGTFKAAVSYVAFDRPFSVALADLNGDGTLDLATGNVNNDTVTVLFGNGNGTFQAAVSYALAAEGITTGDFNEDGLIDIMGANYGVAKLLLAHANTTSTVWKDSVDVDLSTTSKATQTLSMLTAQHNGVLDALGRIGAGQSRLSVALENAIALRDLASSSASKIMEADIAAEAARSVKHQILLDATSALLAQANQSGSLVTKLLS